MNHKHFILIPMALFTLCFSSIDFGQENTNKKIFRNLTLDSDNLTLNIPISFSPQITLAAEDKKSPVLAGVLSGILPGAGELYTGQYLKAGIFLAVETAAITTALIYNHKGNYQTSFFEWYNNLHWSPARYAQWTINNIKYLNPSIDPTQYHVFNSNGTLNWSELNRLEGDIGGGYSHELAQFGTQDYYEITGKYDQFSHGWDTSNQSDTDFHILTPQFLWYAHQRGLANSLYQTSSAAIGALYLNHFLSILDAIWSAHTYNSKISMNVRVQNINITGTEEFSPTLNISYNF